MEYAGGGELYTYVHDNGKLNEEVAKPIFGKLNIDFIRLFWNSIQHKLFLQSPIYIPNKFVIET